MKDYPLCIEEPLADQDAYWSKGHHDPSLFIEALNRELLPDGELDWCESGPFEPFAADAVIHEYWRKGQDAYARGEDLGFMVYSYDTPGRGRFPVTVLWFRADRVEPVLTTLLNQNATLRAALEQIARCSGPYSHDPLKHAENCIMAMVDAAETALSQPAPPEMERLRRELSEANDAIAAGVRNLSAALTSNHVIVPLDIHKAVMRALQEWMADPIRSGREARKAGYLDTLQGGNSCLTS